MVFIALDKLVRIASWKSMRKGEQALNSPNTGHFCNRFKCLIHGSLNARFDLKIFCDPILFKWTTLIEHFDLRKFMFLKIRSKDYFDFAIIFFLCIDLFTSILVGILCSLHVKADKLPWNWKNQKFCCFSSFASCEFGYLQQSSISHVAI